MNMNIVSVAIGSQYELEVERLKKSFPKLNVLTDKSKIYERKHNDDLINGLYHKCNFANYITITNNLPIIFCDADMFSLKENPLSEFNVNEDTDIAFVKYEGRYHFPDKIRQETFDYFGYKINSGFIYFKNKTIAKEVCDQWSTEYLKRVELYEANIPNVTKYEYDEYALMIALKYSNYKIEILDKKWNDFELNTEEEIKASDSIFFQLHGHLNII